MVTLYSPITVGDEQWSSNQIHVPPDSPVLFVALHNKYTAVIIHEEIKWHIDIDDLYDPEESAKLLKR